MANITLAITEELREQLQRHKEVNWSAVIRNALQEHLARIKIAEAIAQKGKLTKKDADEISRIINSNVAKKLGIKNK